MKTSFKINHDSIDYEEIDESIKEQILSKHKACNKDAMNITLMALFI